MRYEQTQGLPRAGLKEAKTEQANPRELLPKNYPVRLALSLAASKVTMADQITLILA
jgi:hypothetical protein